MKKSVLRLVVISIILILNSCDDDDVCSCTGEIFGKWEVKAFISLESTGYPKDNDYNPIIEFKKDGTIEIQLDVNSCFGDFEMNGESTIDISNAGCTEACCDSKFSEKFIEMLPQVGSYEVEDDELKLNISGWGWIKLKLMF